ncbi:MAG: methyltransferase domain-containing protein [Candidatus Heimdallarchaeota archaeon]|nr:MAG: methyltransferase domain-containing protein [Candidatus Heimdallarchaeota archaeon]
MRSILTENTVLSVGIPHKNAEEARLQLLRHDLLLTNLKPIKTKDLVFFPVVDHRQLSKLLHNISFTVQECTFPIKHKMEPIHKVLKKEFPDIQWNDTSLKFDQLGDIVVLKLHPRKISLSVRQRVGELILSYSKKIKTVLNKSDVIEGAERIYPIEHLAGEKRWKSWHQEYGVLIWVDLKRAYFNPRLAEEHHRVAVSGIEGKKILDMFTGVGPFALHCAKHALCEIVAIDINPYAIAALQKSIKKNKLKGNIHPIIADSLSILRMHRSFDRIIINLPDYSINYLSLATKLLKKGGIVTFYQFISKTENPKQLIRKKISSQLTNVNSYKELNIKVGREISPSRIQVNVDLLFTS